MTVQQRNSKISTLLVEKEARSRRQAKRGRRDRGTKGRRVCGRRWKVEAEAGKREVTRDHRPLCVITSYPARTVLFNRAKVQAHSSPLSLSLSFPFFLCPPRRSFSIALLHRTSPLPPRLAQSSLMQHACSAPKKAGKVKKRCSEGEPGRRWLARRGDTQIFEGENDISPFSDFRGPGERFRAVRKHFFLWSVGSKERRASFHDPFHATLVSLVFHGKRRRRRKPALHLRLCLSPVNGSPPTEREQ